MSKDLTQGAIGPWLYRLTAPMVMGIMAIFLFNLVDTYFVSLLGTQSLAAISFTFPVTMMVMNIAIGLSIATGAVVARAIGQKNHSKAKTSVTSSFYLALFVGLVVGGVGLLTQERVFRALGADEVLIPLIKDYLSVWYMGSALLIVLIAINASIRATGNTKLPSYIMLLSAAINGVLDPLLIFGLGPFPEMGIQGAAVATVISWLIAFIVILKNLLSLDLVGFRLTQSVRHGWKKLISLGIPAALTNMLGPLANGILVAWVASYGTQAVAAYGVGSRLEPLALIVVMAFTASLPPFVGQNHGAYEFKRIESALMKSMRFILIWQLLVYGALVIFAHPISRLFSDDPDVQTIIRTFIYIVPISYFGMGFSLVCTATINALHKTRISLNINLIRLFAIYIPMAWVGHRYFGLEGIFWGCALGNLTIGILMLLAFKKVRHDEGLKETLLGSPK